MSKLQITIPDIIKHMHNTWELYASEVRDGMLCRFWYNGNSQYQVTQTPLDQGQKETIVLETFNLKDAVEKFNNL